MTIFGAPSSIPRSDRRMRPLTFLYSINAEQLLFDAFLDMMRVFDSIES